MSGFDWFILVLIGAGGVGALIAVLCELHEKSVTKRDKALQTVTFRYKP